MTLSLVALVAVTVLLLLRRLAAGRAPPEVVRAKLAAGAQVVDVRTRSEFRAGAYPGAVSIPLQELPARAHELRGDRPVVVYCASGTRSGAAARLLRRAGLADVVNAGGLAQLPRR